MKVSLFMAVSFNGMIARNDHTEDFLDKHGAWEAFCTCSLEFGNYIIGRKTYEVMQNYREDWIDRLKTVDRVVLSHDKSLNLLEGHTPVSSPQEAIKYLEQEGFEKAVVIGGSKVNSAFVKEGLIDSFIFHVSPVMVGEGIPIFDPFKFDIEMKLTGLEKDSEDGYLVKYDIVKQF
jgi:dihydrofolate reductase